MATCPKCNGLAAVTYEPAENGSRASFRRHCTNLVNCGLTRTYPAHKWVTMVGLTPDGPEMGKFLQSLALPPMAYYPGPEIRAAIAKLPEVSPVFEREPGADDLFGYE